MSTNGAGRPVGVLVIDPVGQIFARLSGAIFDVPLWRIPHREKIGDLAGIGLIVYAAYEKPDWSAVKELEAQAPTVVITMQADPDCARQAIALGAFGCLGTSLSPAALRRAIGGALRGEPAFPRDVLGEWIKRNGHHAPRPSTGMPLTPRQFEVVALVAKGAADKEIGIALGISTATAQKHVSNVLKRLRVPNRAAAAAAAVKLGL